MVNGRLFETKVLDGPDMFVVYIKLSPVHVFYGPSAKNYLVRSVNQKWGQ